MRPARTHTPYLRIREGLPVTFLEARDLEIIHGPAVTELPAIKSGDRENEGMRHHISRAVSDPSADGCAAQHTASVTEHSRRLWRFQIPNVSLLRVITPQLA